MIKIFENKEDKYIQAEKRLDDLFSQAFSANDPAMLDWVTIKFRLQKLNRIKIKELTREQDSMIR